MPIKVSPILIIKMLCLWHVTYYTVIDGEVTRLLPNKRSIDVHSIGRYIMMIIYVRSTIAGVSVFFCVQAEGKML